MKIVFPGIDKIFEITENSINSLIIENQSLLVSILTDLINQLNGGEGNIVVSENNRILRTNKCCELLYQFIPFELNTKPLVSKLAAFIERKGISFECYEDTQKMLSDLEKYFYKITFDLEGDIAFNKINLNSIIKAIDARFADDYNNLAEKIIDYMELVKEYDENKIFITLNLRDYISDPDMESFISTALGHNLKVFMIECRERKALNNESRYIVDRDLCEIC